MRGYSLILLPVLFSCVTNTGQSITPDQSPGSYFRIKLSEACNYVPTIKRDSCQKKALMDRSFSLFISWISGRTPIGLPIWSQIPRSDYWRDNYFDRIKYGWDFYNRPNRYLPGNCVYRVPVKPGSGRYLLLLKSNVNSDMSLRLDISIFSTLPSSGEQGRDIGGIRILYIPQEINPGESLTFEFDSYDLRKYTYSIDATPEKEEPCVIEPGFGD